MDNETKRDWVNFLGSLDLMGSLNRIREKMETEEQFGKITAPDHRMEIRRTRVIKPVKPERLGANVGHNPSTGELLQMLACWIPDGRLATVTGISGTLVHTDLGLFDLDLLKPAKIITVNQHGMQTSEMG